MARNLPLIFGLALAGGLLVEHGAKLFAGTFGGGSSDSPASGAAPAPADVGLSSSAPASADALGDVTPGMLASEASLYGWGQASIAAWRQVITKESSGKANALGSFVSTAAPVPGAPGGGQRAWGIGQFLGSTLRAYASLGATSSQPGPQVHAMGVYIHRRYGSPEAALAHENQFGWY